MSIKLFGLGFMFAGILASHAAVVRGAVITSSSISTYANAAQGPVDYGTTSAHSDSVVLDGSTPVLVSADAHASASASGHSLSMFASADVVDGFATTFAYGLASASLTNTVFFHSSSQGPAGGNFVTTINSRFVSVQSSAVISGSIQTFDAQGSPIDSSSFLFSAPPPTGETLTTISIPAPILSDGDYAVAKLDGDVSVSADNWNPTSLADLSHTVWLQFVADDPFTLSAIGEDGWDFSTPYTPSASLPEPSTLGVLGVASFGLLRRRRKLA